MTCILIFGDDEPASVNSSGHADPNLFLLTLLPENFSAGFFLFFSAGKLADCLPIWKHAVVSYPLQFRMLSVKHLHWQRV